MGWTPYHEGIPYEHVKSHGREGGRGDAIRAKNCRRAVISLQIGQVACFSLIIWASQNAWRWRDFWRATRRWLGLLLGEEMHSKRMVARGEM